MVCISLRLTVEGGPHEHAQPHDSRILNFYANFGRADIGIEDRPMLLTLPLNMRSG